MRRQTLRLHAPFVALALVQAAFVAWAPRDERSTAIGTTPPVAAPSSPTALGQTVSSSPATRLAGSTHVTVAEPDQIAPSRSAPMAADTAHCVNGRQTDVIYGSPPCAPRFSGTNGGATYPGVTAEEIRVVAFECQTDEQVGAILATQGVVSTAEERDAVLDAVVRFINERYETYGRTVVAEREVGDCPTTPPDPARARQAALEVARTEPALVFLVGGDVAAADAFTQSGIMSVGLLWNGADHFASRRPFRWDVFPTATETAAWSAEYFCKKLAGRPAGNAGRVIHASIGGRETPRKLGIVVPDDGTGATRPSAQALADAARDCGGTEVPVLTYQSDITRATEQARSVVAALIDEKVTTVACMCDAVAPVFFTQTMTQNGYYPEHLLTGMGLLDDDALARLYDPPQWTHAFGLSQLTAPVPLDQTDAAKVWRAVGNEGNPCAACTLWADYLLLIGSMIHLAGPDLDPGTVERALVGDGYRRGGWLETGGDPTIYLTRFGSGDYNAISDVREIFWDPAATSAKDGRRGAYVAVEGGRRYSTGELSDVFSVAPKAG